MVKLLSLNQPASCGTGAKLISEGGIIAT
jgi:hypothetical protein